MPDWFACFYADLRKYMSLILIVGGGISIALAPQGLAIYVLVAWMIFSLGLFAASHQKTRVVCRQFGGNLVAFANLPTPIDTLLDLLTLHGIPAKDIESITMMSTDLNESLDYLFGKDVAGAAFGQLLRENPGIKAVLYGYLTTPVRVNHPAELKPIPKKRTEHTNLIVTKDQRAFVWYEPYHLVVDGKHYFTRGAYLIEIPAPVRDRIINEYYPSLLNDTSERGVSFSIKAAA